MLPSCYSLLSVHSSARQGHALTTQSFPFQASQRCRALWLSQFLYTRLQLAQRDLARCTSERRLAGPAQVSGRRADQSSSMTRGRKVGKASVLEHRCCSMTQHSRLTTTTTTTRTRLMRCWKAQRARLRLSELRAELEAGRHWQLQLSQPNFDDAAALWA